MSILCQRRLASFTSTLVVFSVLSCSQENPADKSNQQRQPAIQYDQELAKISTNAALMQLTSAAGRLTQCSLSESLDKISVEKQDANASLPNKMLDDMKMNAKTQCEVFSRAERETKSTFDKIKEARQLLEQQYFFSIFVPSDSEKGGETFDENEIGLFSALDQCKKIEQEAFDKGIPVRKCGLFKKDPFLSPLAPKNPFS